MYIMIKKMLYFHWTHSRVNEVMGTVRAI